jgi:hypothetical protein
MRARALARETVDKMMTQKLESKVPIQEYNGKTMETKIWTLGFIGSFSNLETFSAKR